MYLICLNLVASSPNQTTEYWVNNTKDFDFGNDLSWNYQPLNWIFESALGLITKHDQTEDDEEETFYYDNLPTYLRNLLPLQGTSEIATEVGNTIYLPDMTLLYMIKIKEKEDSDEDMDGWTYTGNQGHYLGPNNSDTFRIHQQVMAPGLYTVYNADAFYLFLPGKS